MNEYNREELELFKGQITHLPSTLQTLEKGELLYAQGDQIMNRISIVEKGILKEFSEVDVSDEQTKQIIHNILTACDIINPGSINSQLNVHTKTVVALGKKDSVIIRHVDKDIFMQEIQKNPELRIFIMRYICNQLQEVEEKQKRLVFENSDIRIYNALVSFIDLFGRNVGYEVLVELPLTYEGIGSYSQTSRQTVTTLINDLKRENLIYSKKRGRLLFRDPEEIRRRAKR